jgi:hypothetical protein
MQIRVGYELIYDCPQPTPMMLMLNIHHTRASDIFVNDVNGLLTSFCINNVGTLRNRLMS